MTSDDIAERNVYLELNRNESRIIAERMRALLTFHGFLFAAVGISAIQRLFVLALLLALVGAVLCIPWHRSVSLSFEAVLPSAPNTKSASHPMHPAWMPTISLRESSNCFPSPQTNATREVAYLDEFRLVSKLKFCFLYIVEYVRYPTSIIRLLCKQMPKSKDIQKRNKSLSIDNSVPYYLVAGFWSEKFDRMVWTMVPLLYLRITAQGPGASSAQRRLYTVPWKDGLGAS